MKKMDEWYQVALPSINGSVKWRDCFSWCVETWGQPGRENGWSTAGAGKVYFNHEKDAIMFSLRWL